MTLLSKAGRRGATLDEITYKIKAKAIEESVDKSVNEVADRLERLTRNKIINKLPSYSGIPVYVLRVDA